MHTYIYIYTYISSTNDDVLNYQSAHQWDFGAMVVVIPHSPNFCCFVPSGDSRKYPSDTPWTSHRPNVLWSKMFLGIIIPLHFTASCFWDTSNIFEPTEKMEWLGMTSLSSAKIESGPRNRDLPNYRNLCCENLGSAIPIPPCLVHTGGTLHGLPQLRCAQGLLVWWTLTKWW